MVIRKHVQTGLVAILLLLSSWASADTQFRLIIDASGSMLISDPDKLTAESLKLISDLAPEEQATLGVWLFGEQARVLLPEARVNSATKARLSQAVSSYTPGDLKTDLESIVRMLLDTPDEGDLEPGFERHWVLVTDGMVDVSLDKSVNDASRSRILNELATQLAERGIHLHTVSMTSYADKELLQSVSTLTDAIYTEVATPDEMLDTFDRIFSQAAPSEEVPFEGNTFFIDDAIEEATLLIFNEEGETPVIYRPNGERLNLSAVNVSAVTASHYFLATIAKPDVGTWRVENVDLARSNIRVITKLSAQTTQVAPVVFINEPIYSTLGLFQDNQQIEDPELLNLVEVRQRLNLLSGESTKQLLQTPLALANNQFKNKIEQISEEGNYELISEVDGKTFVRKVSQFFSVAKPITLQAEQQNENLVLFSAKPTNLRLNMLRSNARLIITSSGGAEQTLDMPLIGEGFWQKVYPVSPNSSVTAHVHVIGITQTGMRFEYDTPPWYLTRDGAGEVTVSRTQASADSSVIAALATANRELTPVVVTPQVAIVSEAELSEEESAANAATTEQAEADAAEADEPEATDAEPSELTTADWVLYGTLNGIAIVVLAAGYLIFRQIRRKRKQKVEDELDV
ncbi:hypothetical protein MAQ5080_02615 [Marinomonas aquimarina]|uniref:VWFA domain-containing protein n=1 Tax=Marinomonas aquimarina TaxID=295068 RepID=A0A1A8TJC4_9GAMM|nr:VWA domain-containing protein [Marinomonas aquimarina]SBS33541.1 hypothetical protein MAQ5080_02615 [Marinomonas aquimarina]